MHSGGPAWKLIEYFPAQGDWSEDEYLIVDSVVENNTSIELVDGRLEFLTHAIRHQMIYQHLLLKICQFCEMTGAGEALFRGYKMRLSAHEYRLPDVMFFSKGTRVKVKEDYCTGADLIIEVLGKTKEERKRDLIDKRRTYAEAGISEYWIVDPQKQKITVLSLTKRSTYAVYGEFKKGERAESKLLKGFSVDVDATFAAGKA